MFKGFSILASGNRYSFYPYGYSGNCFTFFGDSFGNSPPFLGDFIPQFLLKKVQISIHPQNQKDSSVDTEFCIYVSSSFLFFCLANVSCLGLFPF